jgi:hypothetical protein
MEDRRQCLERSAILFSKAGRRIPKPRRVQLFREPIKWFDTARYLGVTLDTRLTWWTHIDQARKKEAQRLGMLGPLLNRSWLSVRNGVLLYTQLIRPMLDSSCPVWRSAALSHNSKVQVLLPVHLGTLVKGIFTMISFPLLYRPHQISERLDTKLSDVGNPLVTQHGRNLRWRSVDPGLLKQGDRDRQLILAVRKRRLWRHNVSCPAGTFRLPWGFYVLFFLGCKVNAMVQQAKTGNGLHSSHVIWLNFTSTYSDSNF